MKIEESEEKVVMRNALDEIKEDGIDIGVHRQSVDTAVRMLKAGKASLEDIAEWNQLPLEEVLNLKENLAVENV